MKHSISTRRRALLAATAGAAFLAFSASTVAQAQQYPQRPIKIVSIASAGTGIDDYTRLLAKFLGDRLGQSVVVENRPGANMILANDYVAKSAPDGYTLLMTASSAMSANPILYTRLPYSPSKDFVPVARMSTLPIALVVSGSSPYKTVAELVAAARAKPGAINGGSSGNGYRLMAAAFTEAAGIKTTDVPYKATSGLLPDLISGTVDYSMLEFSSALPMVQAGKLRALAVLSPKRVPLLPGVPTLSEAGVLDSGLMEAVSRTNWTGLYAPAGTPAPIVEKLAKLTQEFVTSPEAMKHYAARGSLPNPGTGADLTRAVQADQQVWKRMIVVAGIQPE
ncbi:tripartite tricarboxylate transporter substrate binding protein [Cupriavidus necator]|uniref:Tripartite tricarboxylate transporter substrate binding protein n=1 Tax=Cupriavidus necator TaxID=106590 RepID=A0A367PHV6_CUPNE|nr:tripartite tricarboxylate transporter substrate binding protein [Cupriavidus necator]QQX82810.1 tripartite tricarboxylate transporter substrate binding protein [Cupriavidus necator]RCJ07452.1 tripartite tricarboxylate transporter substrate binding protein [Cupriavidus necator]